MNLHQVDAITKLNNALDELAHTVDIHQIGSQYQPGKHNTPNVGVFVW
ncbi:MAG: hypothetical protein V7L20_23100 [Nostoc sp.]